MGTPKSKGSGPYDRQSSTADGRKGVEECSLVTVSEFGKDNLSQKTEDAEGHRDPIPEIQR